MTPEAKENLRFSAMNTVHYAIKRGRLAKLDGSISCADCGAPAVCYDHRDYRKKLEVEPVCKRCNGLRGQGAPFLDGWMERAWDAIDGIREAYDPEICKFTSEIPREILEAEPCYEDPSVYAAMQELYCMKRPKNKSQKSKVIYVENHFIALRKCFGGKWKIAGVRPISTYAKNSISSKKRLGLIA